MTTLSGMQEFVQEIRSPGNVFLEIFGCKKDYLPKLCPDKIPLVELVEGNLGDVGCTIRVRYSLGGKELISRETVEAVDKENQSMTYNIFEGDLMKMYKTLKITFQVTSKDEKNYLKWTYIYEKVNADVPDPEALKDLASEITSIVDAHYMEVGELKNKN
ncbi:hypothetical protein ACH5RR_029962 [Cinchona calisaya]|uniref:Bet v I/Major latex protein domain-containing protein n=1 Tax=Cinchona calisaya TaxID=153742 RepID=A0ABD2YT64_9GENT